MDIEELRAIALFEGLSNNQLTELADAAEEVAFQVGDVPFREGEYADSWWVFLEGALALIRRMGNEEVEVARMDTVGQWSGGFRAWDADGVYLATGRGTLPGRLLRLDVAQLRDFVSRWFPLAGHLIGGLHHTARSIESTARQRDALVTLGTLAAGLAHEINNPAAAAIRGVESLSVTCDALLNALARLAGDDITAAQFAALDALRREVTPLDPLTNALERADREDAIASWLGGHGVAEPWGLASALAPAGVDVAWCDRAAAALPPFALEPALSWVAATFSATSLLAEVGDATRRISELVGAVRSYSQLDRASRQSIDVREGLESTLTMLSHKLRDGVNVVRDFADTPHIDAYPGELNQVWTNLIDNAVDAMGGSGQLTIRTRADGDGSAVVVEITDDGQGMPPDVAARAFEPFFTTKDVGKGTGLGLDIARRIVVERHGGTIVIDSGTAGTTLRVRLPTHHA